VSRRVIFPKMVMQQLKFYNDTAINCIPYEKNIKLHGKFSENDDMTPRAVR
jgi:hypothetical protein